MSLEGVMLVGALSGFLAARATDSWVIGLVAGALIGALFALIYGYLTIILRADMIVVGVAMILIATGVVDSIGADYVGEAAASQIPNWHVPGLSDIPYVGPAVFEQSIMTYVAFLLPIGAWWLLSRTRHGLNMQAIGENPAAADNAGIAVVGWRLTYTAIGGAFAGVGGAILTLSIVGSWVSSVTAGQGWIAFALVFFAGWRPLLVLVGAYLFGALTVLGFVGQAEGWDIPSQVFTGLPYAATVLLMILRAWLQRRRGVTSWPAALGLPFYRG
ncbi:MAG TPA: ABC transporter permease [Solirubrobacterales bacterium]|nr:ABC transporter permease [Solirubrobacterales bacterium]